MKPEALGPMLIGRGSSSASMRFLSANMSMLKLTRVPRVPTLGELTASMPHEVKQPPPAAGVTNAELACASCLTSSAIDLATLIEPYPQRAASCPRVAKTNV